ncbi:MAG: hypothetical protein CBC62_04370 [Opitutia bacterium TMED102]|nr:hypothetical protein [Verrucomicrobiales bacterium]OUV40703.1 MAG: hypothetical protein CBC62_04370 [Opitutae bacterium TMED102]
MASAASAPTTAPASAASAGRPGRTLLSTGRFPGSIAPTECIASGFAFVVVEFAILVFIESFEDLFLKRFPVGTFPSSGRAVCRLSQRRLAKRERETKRQD